MAKTEAAQVEPSRKAAALKAANKQAQQQQNITKRGPRLGSYHIDRRARRILGGEGAKDEDDPDPSDDKLLNTKQLARWLEVSTQWLEIGRIKGYGPKFIRIAPRNIMYQRSDVRAWLRERLHASTAEYE
jgi:hypothetical protein